MTETDQHKGVAEWMAQMETPSTPLEVLVSRKPPTLKPEYVTH